MDVSRDPEGIGRRDRYRDAWFSVLLRMSPTLKNRIFRKIAKVDVSPSKKARIRPEPYLSPIIFQFYIWSAEIRSSLA